MRKGGRGMKEIRLTIHANIPQEAIDTWHYGDIVNFIKTQLYEAVDNAVKDGLAKEFYKIDVNGTTECRNPNIKRR